MANRPASNYRLRSNLLLRALDLAARITSLSFFKPIHEIVRRVHSVFGEPLLRASFRSRFPDVLHVQLRHSQTRFGDYHFLLSDVDVSIIVRDETRTDALTAIGSHYECLRQRLLFLGELEIYTQSEMSAKTQIEFAWPNLIELFRLTRKFSWIPDDRSVAYHGVKSRRSLARNHSRLAVVSVSNEVTRLASRVQLAQTAASRRETLVGYMGRGLSDLPEPLKGLVADVTPTHSLGETLPSEISLPGVCLQLCRYEEIQARGRGRLLLSSKSSAPERKSLSDWADQLARYSSRLAPDFFVDFVIHSCRVRLVSETTPQEPLVRDRLIREFGFFKQTVDFAKAADILIRLNPALNEPQAQFKLGRAGIGEVSTAPNERVVQTAADSRLRYRFYDERNGEPARRTRIQIDFDFKQNLASPAEIESEISILINAVHAAVGETLEKNGFLRLHAASVLAVDQSVTLVSAASGAGKSTWALRRFVSTTDQLYSDETTWLLDDKVYPYPTPIALGAFKTETLPATAQTLSRQFLGRCKLLTPIPFERVAPISRLTRIIAVEEGRFKKIKWTFKIVLGLGLTQMWPYLLRRSNVGWLGVLAFRRMRFALGMMWAGHVEFVSVSEFRKTDR